MSGEYVTGIVPKFKCDKHNIIVFYGFYCPTCRSEEPPKCSECGAIKNPPEAEETGGQGKSVTNVAF